MQTLTMCSACSEYGSDFCNDCMKEAIMKEKVLDALHKGICKITFIKKNGEERIMSCTLNEEFLPKQTKIEDGEQKRKPNPDALAVWDTDVDGWRSFRWDSLKDFATEIKL